MKQIGIWTNGLDTPNKITPFLYTELLCKQFHQIEPKAFDFKLLHYFSYKHELYDLFTDTVVPKYPLYGQLYLQREKIDLVHLNGIPSQVGSAVFHLVPKRIPIVATVHGSLIFFPEFQAINQRNEAKRQWHLQVMRRAVKRIDHFITVSTWLKSMLIKNLSIPESKITVVHNGVSDSFKSLDISQTAATKSKYELTRPFILHVSNYKFVKNPDNLLKAFAQIYKSKPEYELIIVGRGWKDNNRVSKQVVELNIQGAIKLIEFLPHADLIPLYNLAACYLHTSLQETFGLPLIEAMSCGCPPICPNRTAMPEVIQDAGLLFENPNDSNEIATVTLSLLNNVNLRKELSAKSLIRSRQFSWQKTAEQTLIVYENQLNM